MSKENEKDSDEGKEIEGHDDGRELDEMFETLRAKVKQAQELETVVNEIEKALDQIKDRLEDQRQTSIKIGTGTRNETKIYIDPSKPKESREIVHTAVDMLYLGNELIEEKENEGDE